MPAFTEHDARTRGSWETKKAASLPWGALWKQALRASFQPPRRPRSRSDESRRVSVPLEGTRGAPG